ncbi:MAG: ribosomal-protein-alanine N-acetyltransferase [Natronomonas sp.]
MQVELGHGLAKRRGAKPLLFGGERTPPDGRAVRTAITHIRRRTVDSPVTTAPSTERGVDVRPAERVDLLEIYRIETDSFTQPWPFSAFEQYLGEPGFFVAMDESVLGYIIADVVSNQGIPLGHIKDIAVQEQARGEGIGRLLLTRAISRLEAEQVHAIKLEVRESNERAIALYRSHGFEHRRTIEEYYDDGEDALLLVRPK